MDTYPTATDIAAANDLFKIMAKTPSDKLPIVVAITEAFINGMKAQERLTEIPKRKSVNQQRHEMKENQCTLYTEN